MTVWLVRIWAHKNADEKAHTLSRRSKNVKKRTKTYEKRILCKPTLSLQTLIDKNAACIAIFQLTHFIARHSSQEIIAGLLNTQSKIKTTFWSLL